MAIIESLKSGMRLIELVAEVGQPLSMPALIENCAVDGMSEASVRNTVETLVAAGWLMKYSGKGAALEYGLGEKAAKLWPIYLGRRFAQLERTHMENSMELVKLREMMEAV